MVCWPGPAVSSEAASWMGFLGVQHEKLYGPQTHKPASYPSPLSAIEDHVLCPSPHPGNQVLFLSLLQPEALLQASQHGKIGILTLFFLHFFPHKLQPCGYPHLGKCPSRVQKPGVPSVEFMFSFECGPASYHCSKITTFAV